MTGIEQLFPLLLFVFGLAFGSFANVVIWRFPRGESLSSPGSHCPSCDHAIRWYDNIPVISWLVLRGRCRDCEAAISMRYPAVELATALLWFACGVRFGFGLEAAVACVMCYLLLILAAIDFDVLRLPNPLVAILGVVGIVAASVTQFFGVPAAPLTQVDVIGSPLVAAALGATLGGGLSWLIAATYRGVRGRSGFGMGDVKLLLALGPYLGVFNFGVLFLGSVFGAVWGVVGALRGAEGMQTKIPFGPFLALAAIVIAFAGPGAWEWYASLVGLG